MRNYSSSEWITALTRADFLVASLTPRKLHPAFDAWGKQTSAPPHRRHPLAAGSDASQRTRPFRDRYR